MAASGFTRRDTMKERKEFKVAAIFDTETTNIGTGAETRAYPILYIFNDLRDTPLESYTPDTDDVRFTGTRQKRYRILTILSNMGVRTVMFR